MMKRERGEFRDGVNRVKHRSPATREEPWGADLACYTNKAEIDADLKVPSVF
jgi:hypothetical protein